MKYILSGQNIIYREVLVSLYGTICLLSFPFFNEMIENAVFTAFANYFHYYFHRTYKECKSEFSFFLNFGECF